MKSRSEAVTVAGVCAMCMLLGAVMSATGCKQDDRARLPVDTPYFGDTPAPTPDSVLQIRVYRATPAPPWRDTPIAQVDSARMRQYAESVIYEARHGLFDVQRLSHFDTARKTRSFGPLARIQAAAGAASVPLNQLLSGRIVARIHTRSDVDRGRYPKLGIVDTITYVWMDGHGPNNSLRMVMIGGISGRRFQLDAVKFSPYHSALPIASARWEWVDQDDDVWIKCTSDACCQGSGAATEVAG